MSSYKSSKVGGRCQSVIQTFTGPLSCFTGLKGDFWRREKICLFNYHKLEQSSGAEVANARELVAFLAPLFLPLIQIKDKCKC